MPTAPEVIIPIVAKDKTSGGLAGVKSSLTSTLKDIGKTAAGFLTADLIRGIGRFGKEALELGANAEVVSKSFNALRKDTGNMNSTIESLRKATRGAVNDQNLMIAANQFMNLSLPVGGMEDMWAAAQKLGRAMGMTANQSISDFNTAVGRASPLILDNFGIVLTAAEAQKTYAASIGKTATELTEAERKTAFQTVAIEKLMEKASALGDNTSELGDIWAAFGATMDNFKSGVGEAMLPLLTDIMGVMNDILPAITGIIDGIREGDWESVATAAGDAFVKVKESIWEVVSSIDWNVMFEGIGTFFGNLPFMLGAQMEGINWGPVFKGLFEAWSKFVGSLVTTFIDNLMEAIPGWLQALYGEKGTGRTGTSSSGARTGTIEGLAAGGIVDRPTVALIGEAGPEAVVPLSGSGGGAGIGTTKIIIEKLADSISLDPNGMDIEELTDMLLNRISDKLLLNNINPVRV